MCTIVLSLHHEPGECSPIRRRLFPKLCFPFHHYVLSQAKKFPTASLNSPRSHQNAPPTSYPLPKGRVARVSISAPLVLRAGFVFGLEVAHASFRACGYSCPVRQLACYRDSDLPRRDLQCLDSALHMFFAEADYLPLMHMENSIFAGPVWQMLRLSPRAGEWKHLRLWAQGTSRAAVILGLRWQASFAFWRYLKVGYSRASIHRGDYSGLKIIS
jgi:hypothetical protein